MAIPVCTSDGDGHHLPDEGGIDVEIKALQQARARCDHGSRQWRKRSRRIKALYRQRTDARVDRSRQIAAKIAKGRCAEIAVEALQVSNMVKSAKGTEEHPGANVKAKTRLNRSLHRTAIAGVLSPAQRAAVYRSFRNSG